MDTRATSIPMPMLSWDSTDSTHAFNEWKTFISSFFVIQSVPDNLKWHYLLLSSGAKGHELWSSWQLSDTDKADPEHIFSLFQRHLVGTTNKWVARLELSSMIQKTDENIDDYICRLKSKANSCQFVNNNVKDEQITFQIIKGIVWSDERKALISKGNKLTLEQAITSVQSYQATMHDNTCFAENNVANNNHAIHSFSKQPCKYCGTTHPPRKCPAYGKACEKCGKKNHFKKVCMQAAPKTPQKHQGRHHHRRRSRSRGREHQPSHDRRVDAASLDCGEVKVDTLSQGRNAIYAKLNVRPPGLHQKVTLRVKADTGANGNILPLRCLKQMYPVEAVRKLMLCQSDATLTAVNGTNIEQLGYIDMPIQLNESGWFDSIFYVCDTDGPAILSCQATEHLGIIAVAESHNIFSATTTQPIPIQDCEQLQELYPECFTGIGHLPGKFSIQLKDDAVPNIAAPRRYPIQLKEEICSKLTELESLDIIKKCNDEDPSTWVSSLAFTRKKSGELRICLDPKHLNDAIKRTYYKTPTLEEITHDLNGATVFSRLDAKHGYWGIELDVPSSHLCTFQSPAGKYRFLRLPFGLSVSQDIFQKHMDDIIRKSGPGVIGIADDFIVHGENTEEHDKALHRVMKVAKEHGLVFRAEKCHIRQAEIEFFGLQWSKDGMKPHVKKCDDIKRRPPPRNVQELQSFLGLIQYLSPFIPHLSDLTRTLRQLCKKDIDWEWSAECQHAFNSLQEAIDKDMQLRYFDPTQPVEIEVDSSTVGLGAALIQQGKPIAFASKALTPAESRYANIERELLAVVFGLEKFHVYVYGQPLVVYSDHKPLESIQFKQLSKAPPRLQRMLLRIQPYDINLRYRPGKDMVYADYLSRVSPSPGQEIVLEQAIHTIQISTNQLDKIRNATNADADLCALREQCIIGWPDHAKSVPKLIRNYWSMKDFISIEDGILFAGNRIIMPTSMRDEYLTRIHAHHLGITKCQLRAKECLYWPSMLTDIEQVVRDCHFCLQNAKSQISEPMHAHCLPSQPWEIVSSDLFELDGNMYIIVVDHYSKMPFVRVLKGSTTTEVIKFCRDLFAVHGIPITLLSDNGPQYSSGEFHRFVEEWDFKHVTSSPRYPQSNGFIERMIGTIKPILKKAKQSGNDPQIALLCLRGTPLDSKTASPAELLYGRKIRTNLPAKNMYKSRDGDMHDWLSKRSEAATTRYNETAGSELPELLPGMKVLLQEPDKSSWTPGTVIEKCQEPRSYVVSTPNGSRLRRNRKFLKELSTPAANALPFNTPPTTPVEQPTPTTRSSKENRVRFATPPSIPRSSSRATRKTQRLIEEA